MVVCCVTFRSRARVRFGSRVFGFMQLQWNIFLLRFVFGVYASCSARLWSSIEITQYVGAGLFADDCTACCTGAKWQTRFAAAGYSAPYVRYLSRQVLPDAKRRMRFQLPCVPCVCCLLSTTLHHRNANLLITTTFGTHSSTTTMPLWVDVTGNARDTRRKHARVLLSLQFHARTLHTAHCEPPEYASTRVIHACIECLVCCYYSLAQPHTHTHTVGLCTCTRTRSPNHTRTRFCLYARTYVNNRNNSTPNAPNDIRAVPGSGGRGAVADVVCVGVETLFNPGCCWSEHSWTVFRAAGV